MTMHKTQFLCPPILRKKKKKKKKKKNSDNHVRSSFLQVVAHYIQYTLY